MTSPGSAGVLQLQVLRNVAVNPQPHTLTRPARTGELAPAAAVQAAVQVDSAPPAPEIDLAAELERAYERGHAQGRLDGRREALDAAEIEQLARAREQGLREGREAGARAGQADAMAAVKAALDGLERLLDELPGRFQARLAASEEDMLALCFETVSRILGEQAATADGVRAMLKTTIAQFGARRLAEIRLHPGDVQSLAADATVGAWLRRREGGQEVQIVGDPAIELGGVVLRSPAGRLDARLERQLAALRDALLSARAARGMAATSESTE